MYNLFIPREDGVIYTDIDELSSNYYIYPPNYNNSGTCGYELWAIYPNNNHELLNVYDSQLNAKKYAFMQLSDTIKSLIEYLY